MTKPKRKNTPTIIASAGIILLTIGISLWLYTDFVIRGHEQLLNNTELTQEERWKIEGSLQWWITAKETRYEPLTIILVTIGLCAIEYAIIYLLVQPSLKH
jgi:hypothetical protein